MTRGEREQRDLNPQPPHRQCGALPLSYTPKLSFCELTQTSTKSETKELPSGQRDSNPILWDSTFHHQGSVRGAIPPTTGIEPASKCHCLCQFTKIKRNEEGAGIDCNNRYLLSTSPKASKPTDMTESYRVKSEDEHFI